MGFRTFPELKEGLFLVCRDRGVLLLGNVVDPEGMKPSVTYEGTSLNTHKYKALNNCSVILTKKFSGLYLVDTK